MELIFWTKSCILPQCASVVDSERLLASSVGIFRSFASQAQLIFHVEKREEEGKFHLSIVQSRVLPRKSAQFSVMKGACFCAFFQRSIFLDCEKSKQLNLNLNLRKNSWVISYQICQVPITWINKCWMLLVSVKNTVVWKALINVSFWHHNC